LASLGLVSALVSPEAEHKNIVIIGAGSAGLATSYFLTQAGVSHIILERGDVANTWDNERWDGFHLVNPNWAIRLPGFHYSGDNPDGYLSKQETVDYLRNYAQSFNAPVRSGVSVVRLSRTDESYVLELAGDRQINANCVVVATGAFGIPKTPEFAANLDSSITQLHSNDYVNHERLPEGGVLVVGSGQSGAQIAEELQAAGKKVYLSVGAAGRRPRRYRGKDSSWWNYTMGQFDKTIEDVDSIDDARYGASSHTSGAGGGHDIYLRQLAKDGMTLAGPVVGATGNKVQFRTDLNEILTAVDEHPIRWKANVDRYIEDQGWDFPEDTTVDPPGISDWPKGEAPAELSLTEEGISSVIWATGFQYDFGWIDLPITGERNYPKQLRGVTDYPGLYFMGLQWMYGSKSAQFIGVGEDAEYVANHVTERFGDNKKG